MKHRSIIFINLSWSSYVSLGSIAMLSPFGIARRFDKKAVGDSGRVARAIGLTVVAFALVGLPLANELAGLIGLAPVTGLARAAQADELAALQPLITEDVFAVARVRLDQVDPSWSALAAMMDPLLAGAFGRPGSRVIGVLADPGAGVAAPGVQVASPFKLAETLSEAGAQYVYLPLSWMLQRQPTVASHAYLLTARTPAEIAPLQTALRALGVGDEPTAQGYSLRAVEGGVAVAADRGWRLVDEGPASPRAELSAALTAVGEAPLVVAVVPSVDQRRALRELLAAPSDDPRGEEFSTLASSLVWLAVGYAPGRSLQVVIQTTSADAAHVSTRAIGSLFDSLAALGAAQPAVAQMAGLLEELKPAAEGDRVVIRLDEKAVRRFEAGPAAEAQLAARRQVSIQRLKMIGLALHNAYQAERTADGVQRFPDAAIRDSEGQPLLSWRVRLLPYLEAGELFDQFRLDEPWDSPHNLALARQMPDVYRIGSAENIAQGKTCVVLPIGASTGWPEGRGLRFRDILDGTSNTIMAVEADDAHAVVWTAPNDLQYDPQQPAAGLGGHFGDVFMSIFFDGSVQVMPTTVDPDRLRALFTPAGREPLN